MFYTACFMFQAALLLLALIYSKLSWVLKAGLILLSLGFAATFYRATINALGYPVNVVPSGTYEFLSGMVHEPYPARDDPGTVYLWVVEVGRDIPRALALPYSTDLRKQTLQAKHLVQSEQRVFFSFNRAGQPTSKPAEAGAGTNGQVAGHGDSHVPYDVQQPPTLEFQAPPDTIPQKVH